MDKVTRDAELLPLVVLAVPAIGSLIHGSTSAWQSSLLLMLVLGYVVHVVKVPWAILHAAHRRRVVTKSYAASTGRSSHDAELVVTPEQATQQRRAARELALIEVVAFGAVMTAPLLGSTLLHWLRTATQDSSRFVDPFAIRLFLIASSIKPITYLLGRLGAGTLFTVVDLSHLNPELNQLEKRVVELKRDLITLNRQLCDKDELEFLRREANVPIEMLDKAVRSQERRSSSVLLLQDTTFQIMEQKLQFTLLKFNETSHLLNLLEREVLLYESSTYAALVKWANTWLENVGSGMTQVGSRLEGRNGSLSSNKGSSNTTAATLRGGSSGVEGKRKPKQISANSHSDEVDRKRLRANSASSVGSYSEDD